MRKIYEEVYYFNYYIFDLGLKQCTACGKIKNLCDFSYYSRSKDFLTSKCRLCTYKIRTKYRKEHKENSVVYSKRWADKNKERQKKTQEKYRIENREKILFKHREYNKKYYEKNKDKILEQVKNYYEENKKPFVLDSNDPYIFNYYIYDLRLKCCNKCKRILNLNQFNDYHKTSDKLTSFCKDCSNEYNKEYKSIEKNRLRGILRLKEWKKKNPERDKQNKNNTYKRHREEILEKSRKYYKVYYQKK